jgi:hypothetical protein
MGQAHDLAVLTGHLLALTEPRQSLRKEQVHIGRAGLELDGATEVPDSVPDAPLVEEQPGEVHAGARVRWVPSDRLIEFGDRHRLVAAVTVGASQRGVKGGFLRGQAHGFGELTAGRNPETEPGVRPSEVIVGEGIVGPQDQRAQQLVRRPAIVPAVEKPSRVVGGSVLPPGTGGVGPGDEQSCQEEHHPDPRDALPSVHGLTLAPHGEAPMNDA